MGCWRLTQTLSLPRKLPYWQIGVLVSGVMSALNREREQKEWAVGADDQVFTFVDAQINTNLTQRYFLSVCFLFPGNLASEWGLQLQELKTNSLAFFTIFWIEGQRLHQWAVSIHLLLGGWWWGGGHLDFGYTLESVRVLLYSSYPNLTPHPRPRWLALRWFWCVAKVENHWQCYHL